VIVRTFEGVQALTSQQPTWGGASTGLMLYGLQAQYSEIYKTQPNVRICVDFLSRNIAQLAPHVFRRVSDTDRQRLSDHPVGRWLEYPNPSTSRYRLLESLMADLGVYFEAFWLKVRYVDQRGENAIGLVRLPPHEMQVTGTLMPREFIWTPDGGGEKPFAPSEIVYFNGYNPLNKFRGLSPLETLRRILAEDIAASEQREQFWRNSTRMEGVWERTKDAPKWTVEQQKDFRDQWQEFSGGGAKAGMTAVGPVGMVYKPISFSAKDSEYVASGKLRREVCAAQYHIPQPMVGILEHATFSNVREQHKHVYQDTLAPWLEMIQQELERQLLPESDDVEDVYVEFNIAAKLQGSFEERATALQISVGKPWRTVNEARAIENLPRDPDPASDRIAPQQGGPSDASANPTPPPNRQPSDEETDDAAADNALVRAVITGTRRRQRARLHKLSPTERSTAFFADIERWNRELADDLTPIVGSADAARLALQANVEMFTALEALEPPAVEVEELSI